jgi:hypothetical protein
MRLFTRRFGLAAVTAGFLACTAAAPAGATTAYHPTDVILPKGVFVPTGMSVNQHDGALYVAGLLGGAAVHRFDRESGTETIVTGAINYQSVAVNPATEGFYAFTVNPFGGGIPRIESYDAENELTGPPFSDPTGKGQIASDSSGNVFVPDIGPINELQKVSVIASAGTYTLTFEGQTTNPIEYNADESVVQTELGALSSIGDPNNISVSKSAQTFSITFQGALANTNVGQLTADDSGLTGAVHVETTIEGSNAPPSVHEYSSPGTLLQTLTCGACPGGEFTATPAGVAIDNSDNVYVGDPAGERVVIFHATPGSPTDYTSIAPTQISTGSTSAIAVNPSTGEIFVGGDDGSGFHVKGFEPNGTEFVDFGLGLFPGPFAFFGGTQKLAVDSNSGTVYVNELDGATFSVKIFGFGPSAPPTIEPDTAVVNASRHATMKTLVNPNGTLVLSCKFEYGPTEAYGTTVPCNDPGFGTEPVSVGAEAIELAPDTTYHYRVTATNEGGTTVGPDQTFKTLIDKAIPATGGAAALQTTATLEGSIDPLGNPLTDCFFEYGPDAGYGSKAPCASLPEAAHAPVPISAAVGGLTPNSGYHYRLVAVNAGGTEFGADREFATLPKAPAITTGTATLVGADRARIFGTVNPEGSVSRYQFEYGPTSAYGKSTPSATGVGSEVIKVAENITGLQPATTYHYRLSATSVGGTTQGPDMTFTTGPRPIGRVFLPAKAPLKGRDAAIEVQCRGLAIAECRGTLVLRARIKQGIRFILVKVGETAFDFFGGQKRTIVVHLNKAGKKVIAQSEGKPIPAVASAANKNRVVRLSHDR